MVINKDALIKAACNVSKLDLPHKQMHDALTSLSEVIIDLIKEGNTVIFGGIGRFEPVVRGSREARNPATGEVINVPERATVKFRMSSTLKLGMRNIDPGTFQNDGSSVEQQEKRSNGKARQTSADNSNKKSASSAKGRRS